MYQTRLLILLLSVMLSSCGFKPVYGQQEVAGNTTLASIYVDDIPNREGQVLRNKLNDLLNPDNTSAPNIYTLAIKLTKQRREFGIQEDLRVTRYDIVLTADYTLIDASNNKVMTDTAKIYSSFNRTTSEFSTFVAEEDSTEKAAQQLAYEIRGKLAAHFSK